MSQEQKMGWVSYTPERPPRVGDVVTGKIGVPSPYTLQADDPWIRAAIADKSVAPEHWLRYTGCPSPTCTREEPHDTAGCEVKLCESMTARELAELWRSSHPSRAYLPEPSTVTLTDPKDVCNFEVGAIWPVRSYDGQPIASGTMTVTGIDRNPGTLTAAETHVCHYREDMSRDALVCECGSFVTRENLSAGGYWPRADLMEKNLARALFRVRMHEEICRRAEIGDCGPDEPAWHEAYARVEAIMWERETAIRAECEAQARKLVEALP